ncbi:unknown protein [Seminavis robusta]|uniref:Uncharacterized protein n=1 Tax=Seminavis robusta TaxID=568900 RepID=A0A9N8EVX4_9STRA|nr:unknown protein [Seminavis robusta]|eukprot:Sro1762_g295980.1 n/a (960) ;mRNA; r:14042-17268
MLSTLMMWITVDFLFLVALATSTPDAAGTSGSTRSGTRTFQTQLIFTHRMDLAVEEYKQGIPFNAKTIEKWIPAQDIAQMESLLLDTFNRPPPQQEVETTAESVLVQITSVHAESQGFLLLNELPRNNNNPEVIQIEVEITYTIRGLCQGPGCTSTGMEGKHDNQDIISSGIRRLRGPGQPQPQHQLDEQIEEEQESDPMTREYHQKLQKALLQLAQSRILVKQPHSHHDTNNYVSNQTKSFMWEDLLQGIQSVRSPPPKGRHRDLQNTEALIDVVEVFCDPLVQSLEISISIDLPGDWRHLINHHDSHNNRTITIANETMTVVDALNVSFVETYNALVFPLCDWPHFRKVSGAQAQTATVFDPFGNTTTVAFDVLAECRNCGPDTPLFQVIHDATNGSPAPMPTSSTSSVRSEASSFILRQGLGLTDDSCLCPRPDDTTLFRAPTLDEFIASFLSELAKIDLPAQEEDYKELKEVPCASDVREFTSYVFLDFRMNRSSNFQTIPEQDRNVLEQSFTSLYNQLSFQSCDPFFRNVLAAKLELNTDAVLVRRQLQEQINLNASSVNTTFMNGTNSTQTHTETPITHNLNDTMPEGVARATTGAVFEVTGRCRGCPVSDVGSFELFDDTFRRQRSLRFDRQHGAPALAALHRNLQGNTLSCVCPTDVNQIDDFSKQDFLDYFNTDVVQLQEDGVLQAVTGVEKLQEGQDVDCEGEKRTFTTTVFVDISVNLEEIGAQEKLLLEDTFRTSYNGLAFSVCDSYFRTVVGASLEEQDVASCNLSLESGRFLQDGGDGTCVCPAGVLPGEGGPVTAAEFQVVFNDQVKKEKLDVFLEAVNVTVDKVMEGQQVECSADDSEFTSYVYVDFEVNRSGDFRSFSEQDHIMLEQSFMDLYNQLSFWSCDPYFRNVQEARLEVNIDTALVRRQLQQQWVPDDKSINATNNTQYQAVNNDHNETATEIPHA